MLVVLWLCLSFPATAQPNRPQTAGPNPCDKETIFCWYGDEVEVWGEHWIPEDKAESTIDQSLEIRCIKKLGVCAKGTSYMFFSKRITRVDIMRITHWDRDQIRAEGEMAAWERCDRDSFVISRADRRVTLISSPGPEAETSRCINFMGKPKTVIYKLTQ